MKPSTTAVPKHAPVITEANKSHTKVAQPPIQPFGVDDPNGHVIKRIKQAKPTVWAKIQNWD